MTSKIYKTAKYGAAGLGIIGIILLVRVILAGDTLTTVVGGDTEALALLQAKIIDPFVTFTFIMLGTTAIFSIGFSLWGLVQNPAALKKALISVGALAVIFFIAYAMANDLEVTNKFGQIIEDGEQGATSKNSGALIIFSYFLGTFGIVTVVWGSVKDMFSKK